MKSGQRRGISTVSLLHPFRKPMNAGQKRCISTVSLPYVLENFIEYRPECGSNFMYGPIVLPDIRFTNPLLMPSTLNPKPLTINPINHES